MICFSVFEHSINYRKHLAVKYVSGAIVSSSVHEPLLDDVDDTMSNLKWSEIAVALRWAECASMSS